MIERHEHTGTAGELHALAMPKQGDATQLWVMRPSGLSLVMGSSQKEDLFDRSLLAQDGVELVGRRSGGGAVYIDPAHVVWIDVLAPRTSPIWSDELTETFIRVGRVWQQALNALGVETELCVSSPARTDEARLACWAGVGWGELTAGGAKIVGLSQRRTRWGARIQAMAVLDASTAVVANYLPPGDQSRVRHAIPVDHEEIVAAAGLTPSALEAAVLHAFIDL